MTLRSSLTFLVFVFSFSQFSIAQIGIPPNEHVGEFGDKYAGLIYTDSTMQKLKYIVDSLDLKFKSCPLDKQYLSKPQGTAHYFELEKKDLKSFERDLKRKMPFDSLCVKYKKLKVQRDLPFTVFRYKNYEGKQEISYSTPQIGDLEANDFEFDTELGKSAANTGEYVYTSYEKSDWSEGSIQGLYIATEPISKPLPLKYARMFQYSDCMVDTSASVFLKNAKSHFERRVIIDDSTGKKVVKPTKVEDWMWIVESFPGRPKWPDNAYDEKNTPEQNDSITDIYYRDFEVWDKAKTTYTDSLLKNDSVFRYQFTEAFEEVKNGTAPSSDDFEDYVSRFVSPSEALNLKRHRIVIGGCSMDQAPRRHAFNIAILAAETINWEIFLRSHLDIMNDNVSRVSDGSWAWGARETYIRELEALDINVKDLLLGICFRVDNASENHYYGDVGRVGRALAEYKAPDEIEKEILSAISDPELDVFNRMLMYYLFSHYNGNLKDEARQKANKTKLDLAVSTLPSTLVKHYKAKKD